GRRSRMARHADLVSDPRRAAANARSTLRAGPLPAVGSGVAADLCGGLARALAANARRARVARAPAPALAGSGRARRSLCFRGATPAAGKRMTGRLPLVTLYLTERCNSRCVTCDYWRHGRRDMTFERVARLLPGLRALGTRVVLVSGGEPLLNPQWLQIAQLLKSQGLRLWLLTSGL